MKKNSTFHRLLEHYIENIGRTDCPPASGATPELESTETENLRAVGQIIEKNGNWIVYLVTYSLHPYSLRFRKSKLRAFPSRRMAEIVARYRVEIFNQHRPITLVKGECAGLCWN